MSIYSCDTWYLESFSFHWVWCNVHAHECAVVFFIECVVQHARTWVCSHVEARGGCMVSSIFLSLLFLRQSFWLKFPISGRLADSRVPRTHLSLLPWDGGRDSRSHAWLFLWMLNSNLGPLACRQGCSQQSQLSSPVKCLEEVREHRWNLWFYGRA